MTAAGREEDFRGPGEPAPREPDRVVRPLAPTGAPGIGEPPASVAAIVRAADRARGDEDAAQAALRAFPRLSLEQIALAREHAAARDAEDLAPRPAPASLLGLALPLGLGMVMVGIGMVGLLQVVALGLFLDRSNDPMISDASRRYVSLLGLLLLVVLVEGFALLALQPLARRIGALLGGFAAVGVLAFAVYTAAPPALLALPLSAASLGLLLSPVAPWCEPDGRAASRTLGVKGYLATVAWGFVVLVALVALPPFFEVTYIQLRVDGPAAIMTASGVLRGLSPLALLALVLAPAPLLAIPARRDAPIVWTASLAGLFAVGIISSALVAPISQALGQR